LIGQAVSGMEATRSWSAAPAWNLGRRARTPTTPWVAIGSVPSGVRPWGTEYRRRGSLADQPVVVMNPL